MFMAYSILFVVRIAIFFKKEKIEVRCKENSHFMALLIRIKYFIIFKTTILSTSFLVKPGLIKAFTTLFPWAF